VTRRTRHHVGKLPSALATLFLTVVPAGTYARELSNVPLVVGLDHIPVAVENLDSAADLFRSLGFALKHGRPHIRLERT
jgi:hypothetical protein